MTNVRSKPSRPGSKACVLESGHSLPSICCQHSTLLKAQGLQRDNQQRAKGLEKEFLRDQELFRTGVRQNFIVTGHVLSFGECSLNRQGSSSRDACGW